MVVSKDAVKSWAEIVAEENIQFDEYGFPVLTNPESEEVPVESNGS